jgi:hypothetical protein
VVRAFFLAHSLIDTASEVADEAEYLEMRGQDHENDPRAHEMSDEAPETPQDEPKPVPVEEPKPDPERPPYVVGDRDGRQLRRSNHE